MSLLHGGWFEATVTITGHVDVDRGAWGVGDDGRTYLDFLSEHRMAGLGADRYFADGTAEALDTPQEFRLVGKTPEEDA
ncbi:MAG: hypothetical protein ABI672_21125, partial [Vicinamibacteria bacterium]